MGLTESSNLSTQTKPGIEEIPQISGFSLIYKGFMGIDCPKYGDANIIFCGVFGNYATQDATRRRGRGAREINNPMERDQKKWIIDF